VDREAIVSSLMGEASVEEIQRLIKWREASPENEATYQRIARIWGASGEFAPAPVPGRSPDAGAIVQAAASRAHDAVPVRRPSRSGSAFAALSRLVAASGTSRVAWAAVAAGILFSGALATFWRMEQPGPELRAEAFVTGIAETA